MSCNASAKMGLVEVAPPLDGSGNSGGKKDPDAPMLTKKMWTGNKTEIALL